MYWNSDTEKLFKGYSEVEPENKERYFTKNLYQPLEMLATGLIRKYWMKLKLFQFQDLKEDLIRHFYLILKDDKINYDKGKAYSYLTKTGYHKLLAKKMKHDNDLKKHPTVPLETDLEFDRVCDNELRKEITEAYENTQEYHTHQELTEIEEFLDYCKDNPMTVIKLTNKKMNSKTIFLQKEILDTLIDLLKDNVEYLENVTFLGELYDIVSEITNIQNGNQIRCTVMKLRQAYKIKKEDNK